jgi:hypothetical protein
MMRDAEFRATLLFYLSGLYKRRAQSKAKDSMKVSIGLHSNWRKREMGK